MQPTYFGIDGKVHETTWEEIFAAAQRVKAFCDALEARFPGRRAVIEKIKYAMLSRHHLLLIGTHGTAKTQLVNAILDAIKGARVWKTQMTKFTKPDDVFGPVNIPLMRETGFQDRLTDGMLPEAHYARIGEFFDANEYMLRALLGIVHERELQIGRQSIKAPLMSVFADTNFRPEEQAERAKEMAALVDRFLFREEVTYLDTKEQRLAMFGGFTANVHMQAVGELSFEDLILVSGVVRAMSLIKDPYVLEAYEEVTRIFSEQREARGAPPISDRREAQGLNVLEVRAILRGRPEVTFEDVDAARLFLCESEEDHAFFRDRVPVIIAEWIERSTKGAIDEERKRLTDMFGQLDGLSWDDAHTKEDLSKMLVRFHEVRLELQGFTSRHAVIGVEALTAVSEVEARIHEGQSRQIRLVADVLPDEGAVNATPAQQWPELLQRLRETAAELRTITPINDRVSTQKREALETCLRLHEKLVQVSGVTERI